MQKHIAVKEHSLQNTEQRKAEMQKVADPADISVLIFGPFWVILGPIWAILGNFRSFLWQNMPLCYLSRFLQLLRKEDHDVDDDEGLF